MAYILSVAPYIKDYEAQIKAKDFTMEVKELGIKELKEAVSLNTHSWRVFKDGIRNGKNLVSITAVIVDFDDGATIEGFKALEVFKKYEYFLYTSRNHNIDKFNGKGRQERFHVAFPFNAPLTDFNAYIGLQEGILEILVAEGLKPDMQVKDLARVFFPSRSNKLDKPLSDFVFYHNKGIDIYRDTPKLSKMLTRANRNTVNKLENSNDSNRLLDAVKHIAKYNATEGLTYAEWIRISASLHNEPKGYEYFKLISATYKGQMVSENEIEKRWRYTDNITQITLGSLYHLAFNTGWEYTDDASNYEALITDSITALEKRYNMSVKADLCRIVLQENKYKLVLAGKRNGNFFLKASDIPQNSLMLGIPVKDRKEYKEALLTSFIEKRYLAKEPYLNKIVGLTEKTKKTESNLKEFLKVDKYHIESFDPLTGELKIIQNVEGDINDLEGAELVKKVLDRIFNHKGFNYTEIINKFLAQLVFEHRTTAKVALVLMGARGTGKSFFINYIAGGFYSNSVISYFGGDFSDWKEASKIISVEESSEHKADLKKLYNDIKDYSGNESTLVNKKFVPVYTTSATAYFIIAMNDAYGFQIQDKGADNTQFIVINFPEEQVITPQDEWHTWGVTPERIKKGLKAYAYKYLLPIYYNMKRFETGFRYGFNTVANEEVYKELLYTSKGIVLESADTFLDQLANLMQYVGIEQAAIIAGVETSTMKDIIDFFRINDFLPNILIDTVKKQRNIITLKKTRIISRINSLGFRVQKGAVRKIDGKSYRGIVAKGLTSYIVEEYLAKKLEEFQEPLALGDDDIPF